MASEEWTTITHSRKGKRKHIKIPPPSAASPLASYAPKFQPQNPEDTDLTLEKLRANFEAQMGKWRNSNSRRTLLHHLDNVRDNGIWDLTKAFCVASGSFSRLNQTNNRRALLQFAAFVDISRHLEGKKMLLAASETERTAAAKGGIKRFAQDPAYTDVDKAFLEDLGVQVVPIPHQHPSFPSWIDPQTFVFEPFIERSLPSCGNFTPRRRDFSDARGSAEREVGGRRVGEREGVHGEERVREMEVEVERERMSEAAIRFVETRRPGKYFPRFEEDEGVFEGLMVYCLPDGEEGEEAEDGDG